MREATRLGEGEFRTGFEEVLRGGGGRAVRDFAFFDLPANRPPWLDTGIDLVAGEEVTSFAAGETALEGTPIRLDPYFQVWFRIGEEGEIFRGTRDAHSFRTERAGRLYLASYFPGEWTTKTGDLGRTVGNYALASGTTSVLLVRWRGPARAGLEAFAAEGDVGGLVAGELDRLRAAVRPPAGWDYLWFMGPAEIYHACEDESRASVICCHTGRDGGILQKDVSLPLRADTRLSWSWKTDILPSTVREDGFPTHDYTSIAVEFENGQDLTYYWSAELPPETSFRCPIPTWTHRETHVVVRSGARGLGEWLEEERSVHRDYVAAIGGEVPERIVRVWLIAVSLFQRREGKSRYADIRLVSGGETVRVS